LIFEVTEGLILPLPIKIQKSTLINRQLFSATGKKLQSLCDASVPPSWPRAKIRSGSFPSGEKRA
jgi:hypothetical protein